MPLAVILRSSSKPVLFAVALGAGILIGSGATWWLFGRRLVDIVERLTQQLSELRREINRLRLYIEERDLRRNAFSELIDDDEDVYEDAYDGPVSWVGGLSSDQVSSCGNFSDAASDFMLAFDDTSSLYARIDRLLDSNDTDKCTAFNELISQENMSQLEACRDKERQKRLVYQALEYAGRALKLDENNPNVHKWYAITLGSTTDYEGPSLKIENGFKFRTHIDKAIELNPTDPTAHYLLGRWCYSVYMMTWVERKMAAALFSVPPSATVDEALSHFMEANRLHPSKWKENLLFIAKCHIEKRDYGTGVDWLDKADSVPVCSQDILSSAQGDKVTHCGEEPTHF